SAIRNKNLGGSWRCYLLPSPLSCLRSFSIYLQRHMPHRSVHLFRQTNQDGSRLAHSRLPASITQQPCFPMGKCWSRLDSVKARCLIAQSCMIPRLVPGASRAVFTTPAKITRRFSYSTARRSSLAVWAVQIMRLLAALAVLAAEG